MINQQITARDLTKLISQYCKHDVICNILDCFDSINITNKKIVLSNTTPNTTTTNCTKLIIDNVVSTTITYLKPISKYERSSKEYLTIGMEIHIDVISKTKPYKLIIFLNNS